MTPDNEFARRSQDCCEAEGYPLDAEQAQPRQERAGGSPHARAAPARCAAIDPRAFPGRAGFRG